MIPDRIQWTVERVNDRGNRVQNSYIHGDRYQFDFDDAFRGQGWQQLDTVDDASYFGIWTHRDRLQVLTFAEGDVTLITAPTAEAYNLEVQAIFAFHDVAPGYSMVDPGDGTVTRVFEDRARHLAREGGPHEPG